MTGTQLFTEYQQTPANNISAIPSGLPSGTYPSALYPFLREEMAVICNLGLMSGAFTFTATGSVNAMVIATGIPGNVTLVTGHKYRVLILNTNTTTTPTLNVDATGAKTVVYNNSAALSAGELQAGTIREFLYDGTNFRLSTVSSTPSGAILSFAMSTAPAGWLVADGSAVSRTLYASLFAAIGTTYGSGDGSTTFNLPNLLGYFVRGFDSSGTIDPGRTFGSTQADSFEQHVHNIGFNPINVGGGGGTIYSGVGANQYTTGNSNSGGAGTETRPKNVALLMCIKT